MLGEDAEDKPVKAVLSWSLDGRQELLLHEGDTAEVGREAGNDLLLPSKKISRKHAVIAWRNGHFEIQDLGSVNGTSVNETPVDNQPRVLKDGDKVCFDTIEVLFSEHKEPQSAVKKADVQQTVIVKLGAQPSLMISTGPGEGHRILLREGVMTVGRATARSENWDIALQDRSVSRPHARVENKNGVVTYTDMGSANGTLHNGQPVTGAVPLKDGDVLIVGETTLIYRGPS